MPAVVLIAECEQPRLRPEPARGHARSCGRSRGARSERETTEARVVRQTSASIRSKLAGSEQSSLITQTQSVDRSARGSTTTWAANSLGRGCSVAMQIAIRSSPSAGAAGSDSGSAAASSSISPRSVRESRPSESVASSSTGTVALEARRRKGRIAQKPLR